MKPIEDGNLATKVRMPETGVANPDALVKMKPTLKKIKPIEDGDLATGLELKPNGLAKLNAFVKMKATA
ncbi:MAG TPA: hypothetical protein VFC65_10945 [Prolixibacteraceae bacterium]|nr:hypothetical protein [Prolixibacteraceae bacterium]